MILLPRDDLEDLRLGVVMSGGVSMAVWMGGVASEVDRLRRAAFAADGSPGLAYRDLVDIIQTEASVDVIAGTSAGGLNGALLATAVAFGGTLDELQRTWMDQGSFSQLLRATSEEHPPSLLRGDEYFLPQLNEAIERIASSAQGPADEPSETRHGLRLFMMTTLFEPVGEEFVDAVGRPMFESDHRGVFEFGLSHFFLPEYVAMLALAARSSAAHPGGFEPSWVPVHPTPPKTSEGRDVPRDALHPDMAPVAQWRSRRFTLDGGLVMNRPLQPLVKAIYEQPAGREVRRLVLLIVPDPPEAPQATELPAFPSMRETAGAALSIPRQQSIAETLREVEQSNREVRRRREVRMRVLAGDIAGMAPNVQTAYREIRSQRFADDHARYLPALDGEPVRGDVSCRGNLALTDLAAGASHAMSTDATVRGWPSWPADPEPATAAAATVLDLLRRGMSIAHVDTQDFTEREPRDPREPLRILRELLHEVLQRLRDITAEEDGYWTYSLKEVEGDSKTRRSRIVELFRQWPAHLAQWAEANPSPWPVGNSVEGLVSMIGAIADAATPELRELIAMARRDERHGGEAEGDRVGRVLDGVERREPDFERALSEDVEFQRFFEEASRVVGAAVSRRGVESFRDRDPSVPQGAGVRWLSELMDLHVTETVLVCGGSRVDQCIDLVHVSANAWCAFDPRSKADEKLTGLQLSHFGAFYRRAWRASDWMWGRLDGCYHLAVALLSPERIRKLFDTPAEAAQKIRSVAIGESETSAELRAVLEQGAEEWAACVEDELNRLFAGASMSRLEFSARWVARRLQLSVLMQELPQVNTAAERDLAEGAAPQNETMAYIDAYRTTVGGGSAVVVPPASAQALLRSCQISRETLTAERGSDLFTRTTATAAAVAVNALGGDRSGLGLLRPVVASVRGVTLALSSIATRVTNSRRTQVFAVTVVVLFASALLALEVSGHGGLPDPVSSFALLVVGSALLFIFARPPGPLLGAILISTSTALWLAAVFYIPGRASNTVQLIALLAGATALTGLVHAGPRIVTRARRLTICLAALTAGAGVTFFATAPVSYTAVQSCPRPLVQFFSDNADAETGDQAPICARLQRDIAGRGLAAVLAGVGIGVGILAARKRRPAVTLPRVGARPAGVRARRRTRAAPGGAPQD